MEELLGQYSELKDELKKLDRAVDSALSTVHHYEKCIKDLELQLEKWKEYLRHAQRIHSDNIVQQRACEIELQRSIVAIKSFSSV